MVIACDIDGVVCDFNTGFAKVLKRINPQVKLDYLDPNFPTCWQWPQFYGYSNADEQMAWAEAKNSGVFWQSLFPYPTAWKDLEFLQSRRYFHDIYFVTSRPGRSAKQETEEWLKGHGFPSPTVVISSAHLKHKFCDAVGADVMIEDKPETLLDLNHHTQTMLIKRPYNVGYWDYFNKTGESVREVLDHVV
jgi:uncharacterized HAD superfamily protein